MRNILILLVLLFVRFSAFAQQSFSGADIDSQSGLSDCKNRVMYPETGTFLQKDPEGISGGLNTYLYLNDNPVIYIDPYGLNWFDNVVNFGTGVGHAVSFGGTRWLRSQFSFYDNTVNCSSGSYSGGQITGNVIAGAAVGAGSVTLIIRGAPLSVAALDAIPGVTAAGAGGIVDMGLLAGGGTGLALTGIYTVNAYQNGDWNTFAFNIGTLGGGAAMGMSSFGGASSGGRYMAYSIGTLTGAGESQAPPMTILNVWGYEWNNGIPAFLIGGGESDLPL